MKKVMSLLLAVMMVLSLAACAGNDTKTDNDIGSSATQNQTDVTDTSSTEQSTDTSSSITDNIGSSDSTDVPSSTISEPTTTTQPETSKPTTTTKPETTKPSTSAHTHSYSNATCTAPAKCSCGATKGSALGHKWQDATCKAPKTCSVCKKTEGASVEHIFDSNGKCEWCKQILPISPAKLQKKSYILTKPIEDSNYGTMIIKSGIDFANEEFWYGDLFYESSFCDVCDTMPTFEHSIWYNGKKYCGFAGAAGGNFTSSLSKNHIFIMFDEDVIIELELLSNNKLRVVEASGNIYKNHISSGDIFE